MGKSMVLTQARVRAFQRKIFRFYARHGRALPFRRTHDPYAITVAEMMLQQTQVERVLPKYRAWMKLWPDWYALANASTRQLLAAWSGLGYNRRCLYLGELAKIVVREYGGKLPDDLVLLEKLPGIGRYTSRAILIFARNEPLITVDTNIKRVLMHEFGLPLSTTREQIEELARRVLPKRRARDWHNALMDFGALKVPRRNNRVGHRQGKFGGSRRQIRGEILRRLTITQTVGLGVVAHSLGTKMAAVREAAKTLMREGVIGVTGDRVRLK